MPLKETPVYRFWVDNNKDILAFDCGVLWLARNTSVLTAAACAEQAFRPYVCKYSKLSENERKINSKNLIIHLQLLIDVIMIVVVVVNMVHVLIYH